MRRPNTAGVSLLDFTVNQYLGLRSLCFMSTHTRPFPQGLGTYLSSYQVLGLSSVLVMQRLRGQETTSAVECPCKVHCSCAYAVAWCSAPAA